MFHDSSFSVSWVGFCERLPDLLTLEYNPCLNRLNCQNDSGEVILASIKQFLYDVIHAIVDIKVRGRNE